MTTHLSTATETTTPTGFADLHLSEPVQRALEEIGYTDPTPVQSATYPIAVAGRDVIVQARTGTGKTAAFGIPLVDKLVNTEPCVQALVLAPTRELAVQSQREIARIGQYRGLHTVAIYGGAPMGRQIDELQSGAQIVSGTPGRVLDHLRRGTLEPSRLKVLVLDEMDEMLSMGFAKELNAILELIPPRGKRQTMCFSATVDGEVRRHAERHMHEPEMISLSSDAVGVEQITHEVYMVSGRDRTGDLVRVLEVQDPESAIIFCNMRSETERVATSLKQAGFNADWLNGDLPQRDRERIMADTREGKLRYLVATDVAARGIDISHLTHVINYTFPESAAVYVHRTGRTGRAGRTGCAVSLVGPEELGRLYYLRLEYKISPLERSMPSSGERKTRQEIDRVALLDSAFTHTPSATDLAVARRLFTHPDGERILAGLLQTFFGTRNEVDEEAAAARRSRLATSVVEEEPRAARDEPRDRVGRGRERDRDRRGRDRDRPRPRDSGPDDRRDRPRVNDRGPADAGQLADDRRDRPRARERDRELNDAGQPADERRDRPRARERDPNGAGAASDERRERPRGRDRDPNGAAQPTDERRDRQRSHGQDRQRPRDREVHDADQQPFEEQRSRERDPDDAAPSDERRSRERNFSSDTGQPSEERRGRQRPRENSEQLLLGVAEGEEQASEASAAEDSPFEAQPRAPRREGRGERRERRERDVKPSNGPEPRRGRSRPPPAQPAAAAAANDGELIPSEAPDDEGAGEGVGEQAAHLEGLLYLNLGKRDGVRVGEVARLLRESCELTRSEIGRIRVRDRYTFVDVPEERLDTIISTLSGQVVHDKALAPERAKTAKT